jgi:hypothetical protein
VTKPAESVNEGENAIFRDRDIKRPFKIQTDQAFVDVDTTYLKIGIS